MQRGQSLASALALAALLAACGGGDGSDSEADPLGARHVLELRSGLAVPVGSGALSLLLTDVRDSRCPITALCVWAGHASVQLQASVRGQPVQTVWIGLPAPAGSDLPGDAMMHGWRLSLQALEPTPPGDAPVPLQDYRARVLAERVQ
ncbi:MAG TPA: hypothetical protein PKO45_07030 [Rubrivivax sp.]|nr:hypothetical protein [Rubrivivax sp.]